MSKRKDFTKENPALNFINIDKQEEVIEEPEKDNSLARSIEQGGTRYKLDPRYVETKSKQINVLIQPSTHKALKKYAHENKISMNEAINRAIKNYIDI